MIEKGMSFSDVSKMFYQLGNECDYVWRQLSVDERAREVLRQQGLGKGTTGTGTSLSVNHRPNPLR
jgi:hypothetical protein